MFRRGAMADSTMRATCFNRLGSPSALRRGRAADLVLAIGKRHVNRGDAKSKRKDRETLGRCIAGAKNVE
jgi:hypothetical protein